MALLRLQDNVPDVFVNNSRDFQLISRIYDCVNNSVKCDIESIKYLSDTYNCNTKYLQLLQSKLGLFLKSKMTDEALRKILIGFPYVIKNKGNLKAIKYIVNIYGKLMHFGGDFQVIHDMDDPHQLIISMRVSNNGAFVLDQINILDELLKYVLPAGYTVDYQIAAPHEIDEKVVLINEFVKVPIRKKLEDIENSTLSNLAPASILRSESDDTELINALDESKSNILNRDLGAVDTALIALIDEITSTPNLDESDTKESAENNE